MVKLDGTFGIPVSSFFKETDAIAQSIKESTCNAGDLGLISESGRSLGEGNSNQSSIRAWKLPWTEESGRVQSMGLQELDMT